MLELQQFSAEEIAEFSYPFATQSSAIKNVLSAERLCSDLTSLRTAFSIQAIPSSVSVNYLDQPGMVPSRGLYPHCQEWAQIKTQEAPSEHQKTHSDCEGEKALAQVARGGGGVALLRDIQKPSGRTARKPA